MTKRKNVHKADVRHLQHTKCLTIRSSALLVMFAFVAVILAHGQAATGTITGFVTDQGSAAIQAATVIITNVETGVNSRATTNDSGIYRVTLLPPGTYKLTVEKAGFKGVSVEGIEVRVDVVIARDVQLPVGRAEENITVQAEPNTVETQTPALSSVIQDRELQELPTANRTYLALAQTAAGVTDGPQQNGEAGHVLRPNYEVNISGMRHTSTNTLYDGIPCKEFMVGQNGCAPPVDAIAEFATQGGYFSAANADDAAVINVVTKSGTNAFHGSAWEFHQDDHLNARNWNSLGKPASRQNIFGFQVGGPIFKNKLFAYASYEWLRESDGSTQFGTVPDPAFLKGDFSSLSTPIVDPVTKQPFPNNQIPASRIDPFAKQFIGLGFIPAPNTASGPFNLTSNVANRRDDDNYLFRLDYAPSVSNKLFGRFLSSDSHLVQGQLLTPPGIEFPLIGKNLVLDWIHVFSPTLVLDVKAGLNRVDFSDGGLSLDRAPGGKLWPQVFGLKNINTFSDCDIPPYVQIDGYSNFGGANSCTVPLQNDLHYIANMQWARGRHHLSWGGEIRHKFQREAREVDQGGDFQYQYAYSGNAFADFMLGVPSNVVGQNSGAPSYKKAYWYNAFIDDDFKVSRSLALSLGLRYQWYPWPTAENHLQSLFNREGAGSFLVATASHPQLISVSKDDFAPRVGFAWSPGGRGDLAVRASFGIFYEEMPGDDQSMDVNGPNRGIIQSISGDLNTPSISIPGLFPISAGADPFQVRNIGLIMLSSTQRSSAYEQIWTLSVEKKLPWNMFAQVAYVGSHGVHLSRRVDINRPDTGAPASCDAACRQARRPWPDFNFILTDEDNGIAYYDGLQSTLRKKLGNGLTFTAAYTYSKTLDTDSYDGAASRNYRPFDLDKSRSTFDVRQRFVASVVYNLPRLTGFANHIFGGWEIAGIYSCQTGLPFYVLSNDVSNTDTIFDPRPNYLGGGSLPPSQRTPQRWFNTAAFVLPPVGQYGDAPAFFLDTDGLSTLNFSLSKNFKLPFRESNLQFRFEGFNALNQVSLNAPDNYLEDSSFGVVSSAQPMRVLQFGLKFSF